MESIPPCPPPHPKHLIFLSHSGHQKGFARDLFARLSSLSYAVFFDQEHHSLPPGQPFPPLIFSAANTCKLAIVVLSHDFLSSRWPMIELCAFADRLSSQSDCSSDVAFTLLPLFLKLSPEDLKNEENVGRWRKAWEGFEQKDGRISASKCEEAVTKLLRRLNGMVRLPESEQGEASYLDVVVDAMFGILPPPGGFTIPYKKYSGRDRLCKVVIDTFRDLQVASSSSMDACILGMYGVPGTGKSTLCRFLCDSMFHEFSGNVVYIELPTETDSHADKPSLIKEQCAKLLSKFNPCVKGNASMDLNMVCYLLKCASSIKKVLLVLDNISATNYESYMTIVQALLNSAILGPGSKIMLVARSPTILDDLHSFIEGERCSLKYRYDIMEVPGLTAEEAIEVIRNQCPWMKKEIMTHLLSKISFRTSPSMYIPFVFEQMGVQVRKKHCDDVEELERLWKEVDAGKTKAVQKLVEMNIKLLPEDLRVLFLDIVLFIIPAGYSRLGAATPILSRMHGISDTFILEQKITDLQKHCTLSVIDNQLRVHDIFTDYASSIPGISAKYVYQPSLDISDLRVNVDPGRKHYSQMVDLKCLEARTIYIGMCTESLPHMHHSDAALVAFDDDQEVRLHVEVGARAQALLVRNRCRYNKCILDLSGELSSLVCFGTENMQEIVFQPCGNDSNLSNLVSLELKNEKLAEDSWMKTCSGQKRKRTGNSFLDVMSHGVQRSTQSMRWLLTSLMFPCDQSPLQLQHVSNLISSGRMRGLRVLILYNVAGIQRLSQNVCQYCPELEILEVSNNEKEQMDIRIHKAPQLKRLVASGCSYHHDVAFPSILHRIRGAEKTRKLALHVRECPELREICVDGSFDQVKVDGLLPSKLRHLAVANDRCPEFLPWKLISSSTHHLSKLQSLSLTCTKVERLAFTRECLGWFPSLEKLSLDDCTGLRHLCVDPGCVPNLVRLDVTGCHRLQVFEGDITLMEKLDVLNLFHLPEMECDVRMRSSGSSCETNTSVQLEKIYVVGSPHVRIDWNVLVAFKNLREFAHYSVPGGGRGSMCESKISVARDQFALLDSLTIHGIHDLQEIEGIQHLRSLVCLRLEDLPNLIRLSGAWPASIRIMTLSKCPMLLEMPSFQQTSEPLYNLQHLSLEYMLNLTRVSGAWPGCIRRIQFRECPMLQEVPPLEQTPYLLTLQFSQCARLKAVQVSDCIEGLWSVEFVECESMEAFPMEGQPLVMDAWRKRGKRYSVGRPSVYGSKFANLEVMQEWLRGTEFGSRLWEAAVKALMWEHEKKGTPGALDALHGYFSALVVSEEEDLQYLRDMSDLLWGFEKSVQIKLFEEWILHKFRQPSDLLHFNLKCGNKVPKPPPPPIAFPPL